MEYKQQHNVMVASLIRGGVSKNTDFADGKYYELMLPCMVPFYPVLHQKVHCRLNMKLPIKKYFQCCFVVFCLSCFVFKYQHKFLILGVGGRTPLNLYLNINSF